MTNNTHLLAELDELRASAIARAKTSGDLTDFEKATAISKSIAEEQKARNELSNADRSFRLTRLQSLLAGTLTIISVLGLIATSVYNIAQLENTRHQSETTEWRELLVSIQKSSEKPNGIIDDITIPLRLRSFANSVRYSREARLMAAAIMARMADVEGFKQLFNFIFPENREEDLNTNLNTMVAIAQEQSRSFNKLNDQCNKISSTGKFNFGQAGIKNICWSGFADNQVREFGLATDDNSTWELRKKFNAVGLQIYFVSGKISTELKNKSQETQAKINDLHLRGIDLSGLNFRNIDISGTYFDGVDFSGAILNPNAYSGALFAGSNWWNAQSIDAGLLNYLITYFYPRRSENYAGFGNLKRPDRAQYTERVKALCIKSGLDCPDSKLTFEENDPGSGVK